MRTWLAAVAIAAAFPSLAAAEDVCGPSKPTTVEMAVAPKWKAEADQIRTAFAASEGRLRLRLRFFPFLDPPANIGIGRCVPAEEARLAIQHATAFNRGVEYLVLQGILPTYWIGIGMTNVPETTWVPVTPADLARLADPALSNEAFHALYRELARLTERKRPFGLDPVPLPDGGSDAAPY
jgi:hypothetical protein